MRTIKIIIALSILTLLLITQAIALQPQSTQCLDPLFENNEIYVNCHERKTTYNITNPVLNVTFNNNVIIQNYTLKRIGDLDFNINDLNGEYFEDFEGASTYAVAVVNDTTHLYQPTSILSDGFYAFIINAVNVPNIHIKFVAFFKVNASQLNFWVTDPVHHQIPKPDFAVSQTTIFNITLQAERPIETCKYTAVQLPQGHDIESLYANLLNQAETTNNNMSFKINNINYEDYESNPIDNELHKFRFFEVICKEPAQGEDPVRYSYKRIKFQTLLTAPEINAIAFPVTVINSQDAKSTININLTQPSICRIDPNAVSNSPSNTLTHSVIYNNLIDYQKTQQDTLNFLPNPSNHIFNVEINCTNLANITTTITKQVLVNYQEQLTFNITSPLDVVGSPTILVSGLFPRLNGDCKARFNTETTQHTLNYVGQENNGYYRYEKEITTNLEDGTHQVHVLCQGMANPNTKEFIIDTTIPPDATNMNTWVISPKEHDVFRPDFFVSTTNTTDVEIETEIEVDSCKYGFTQPQGATAQQLYETHFTETLIQITPNRYKIENFNLENTYSTHSSFNPLNLKPLYVVCKNEEDGENKYSYKLIGYNKIDTNPQLNIIRNPEIVRLQTRPTSNITINSNQAVVCEVTSTQQTTINMNTQPPFNVRTKYDVMNQGVITFSQTLLNNLYNFQATCTNLAGLTTTEDFTIQKNYIIGDELQIINPAENTMTNTNIINAKIGYTKEDDTCGVAFDLNGTNQDLTYNGVNPQTGLYEYQATINSELEDGQHTMYAYCEGYIGMEQINFIIDTTIPPGSQALDLWVTQPANHTIPKPNFFVTNQRVFNLTLQTSKETIDCKYDTTMPSNQQVQTIYDDYFSETLPKINTYEYKITNFNFTTYQSTQIETNIHIEHNFRSIYIICKLTDDDGEIEYGYKRFFFNVLETQPTITAIAQPSTLIDKDNTTTIITITTNQPTSCVIQPNRVPEYPNNPQLNLNPGTIFNNILNYTQITTDSLQFSFQPTPQIFDTTITCTNLANISNNVTIPINIDYNDAVEFYIQSPKQYEKSKTINISGFHTKQSTCHAKINDEDTQFNLEYKGIIQQGVNAGHHLYEQTHTINPLIEGQNTIHVTCEGMGTNYDSKTFILDTQKPVNTTINAHDYSCSTTSITAQLTAQDTGSGISHFEYNVSVNTNNESLQFTQTGETTSSISVTIPANLRTKLINETVTIRVKAADRAGNEGDTVQKQMKITPPGLNECDFNPPIINIQNTTTPTGQTEVKVTCTDTESGCKNYFEYSIHTNTTEECTYAQTEGNINNTILITQDIFKFCARVYDNNNNNATTTRSITKQTIPSLCQGACGTPGCPGCQLGDACTENSQCTTTNYCFQGTCQIAPCDDGLKNGLESGIDCGGQSQCGLCPIGEECLNDADCQTGNCNDDKVCEESSCFNNKKDGDETDEDCGGSCAPCALNKKCLTDSDCELGLCQGGICRDPSMQQTTLETKTKSLLGIILIILGLLAMIAGGVLLYLENEKKKKTKTNTQKPQIQATLNTGIPKVTNIKQEPQKPQVPKVNTALRKKAWQEALKKKNEKRKNVLGTFNSEEKTETNQKIKEETKETKETKEEKQEEQKEIKEEKQEEQKEIKEEKQEEQKTKKLDDGIDEEYVDLNKLKQKDEFQELKDAQEGKRETKKETTKKNTKRTKKKTQKDDELFEKLKEMNKKAKK